MSCYLDHSAKSKKSSVAIIIGAAAGGSVLFLLLVLAGIYAYRQKKKAERATKESNPFGMKIISFTYLFPVDRIEYLRCMTDSFYKNIAHWDTKKSSGSIPQLKGARCFSFEELKKYSNNFSEANDIGSGGYGKVIFYSLFSLCCMCAHQTRACLWRLGSI